MKYYQELTILPDPEISSYFIWSKLFGQLHIALADVKNTHGIDTIGVSFPDYYFDSKNGQSSKLGKNLRVFAPGNDELQKLNLNKWLERLTDYIYIKSIRDVPEVTKYVSVHRYRFKPVEVQATSLAKKLDISFEEAMTIVAKRQPELHVPFIRMYSESNKTHYLLQILQKNRDEETRGHFNVYGMNGMSGNVTVPHW